tara:strand:+ start:147 stop:401 length:255 start_codon:yes stop_codon:yes gene_type:complete
MKNKELQELVRQAKKELQHPVKLPLNAKELLIEKFGSVVNASYKAGMANTTLYRHLKKGFAPYQFRKHYQILFADDLPSHIPTK